MRVPAGPPDLRSGNAHLSLGAALEPGQGAGPWRRLTHSRPKLPGFPAGPRRPAGSGSLLLRHQAWASVGRALSVSGEDLARAQATGGRSAYCGRGRGSPAPRRLQPAGLQEPSRPRAQRWSLDFPLAGLPARSAQREDARGLQRVGISWMEKLRALATHKPVCADDFDTSP